MTIVSAPITIELILLIDTFLAFSRAQNLAISIGWRSRLSFSITLLSSTEKEKPIFSRSPFLLGDDEAKIFGILNRTNFYRYITQRSINVEVELFPVALSLYRYTPLAISPSN